MRGSGLKQKSPQLPVIVIL